MQAMNNQIHDEKNEKLVDQNTSVWVAPSPDPSPAVEDLAYYEDLLLTFDDRGIEVIHWGINE
jgi:hypothetical protein